MSIKRFIPFLAAATAVAGLTLALPLTSSAQTPPAPAAGAAPGRAGAGPAAIPKPGYVVPPENSAGLYPVNGEPIWKSKCAQCHEPAISRAPAKNDLAARAPEEVYDALSIGVMKPMAEGLTDAQLYGIVRFLTGKSPVPNAIQPPDTNLCKVNGPIQPNGPQWNGWSPDVANMRYQPKPGFTAAEVSKLKPKWTFSYSGTKNGEPVVFGDRVFVDSMGGKVYSLDTKTGCVHWRFDYRGGSRSTMAVGKLASAPSKYALYMGDDREFVHAFDAGSGKELWKVQVDDHKVGRITGPITLFDNVIYVPLSAAEESQGNVEAYNCCTFIGTVVAISAIDGKTIWKQSILDEKPHPTRKNPAGSQMYGPAGGAIWSAPTVDAKRGLVYVATGDSYTEIEHPTSDAIVAMDMKTGKIKWATQVWKADNFMSGTVNGPLGVRGPDWDFGSGPSLAKVNGKDMIIDGNKSSVVFAFDPDNGKILWQTPKLGNGGASGGLVWGQATDGKVVFAPLNDPGPQGKPGLIGVDAATGKELWRVNAPTLTTCSVASGRCARGYSGAATAIPGAVFSGAQDGHLRAYGSNDGKLLWDYDTDTVNGVKGAFGGSLDMGGPTVAGGMMFIHSGYGGSAGANNLLLAFSVDGK
jgi:polyvinyl alcohol dehydrogenase (cytochrome)